MRQTDVFDSAAKLVVEEVKSFRAASPRLRVAPRVTAAVIRRRLAKYDFEQPVALPAALRDVMRMMRQWTLHATHPRHFGLFVPGVDVAGIWADALVALYNPQVGAWGHAPAATEIE